MQTIELNLVAENTFGSKFIQYGTNSRYSHVGLVLPEHGSLPDTFKFKSNWPAQGALLGARFKGGVQIREFGYKHWSVHERYKIAVADKQAEIIYTKALEQIGKPYDWRAIINFFLQDRDWRDPNAWFCSELAFWLFEQAGINLLNCKHMRRITPRDISISPLLTEIPPPTVI